MSRFASLSFLLSGEVAGTTKDPSGALLPGAIVVAQQPETSKKFTAVSNQTGVYLFFEKIA